MAAAIKNTLSPGGVVVATLVTKLPRGKCTNLGTLGAANDAVAFSISEPTRDHQGLLVIQVVGNLVGGTYKLEYSLDGGTSWTDLASTTATATADFGDTAAITGNTYTVSGFGGATFRFGTTAFTSGTGTVWALVG